MCGGGGEKGQTEAIDFCKVATKTRKKRDTMLYTFILNQANKERLSVITSS